MLQFDFSNSQNWEQVWYFTGAVTPTSENTYIPIPNQVCPTLLTSRALAVYVQTSEVGLRWKYGGTALQKFQTGLTVGGVTDANNVNGRRCYIEKINIIVFPGYVGTYALEYSIPYWFKDVKITVWEYIGPITDTTEEAIDLVRIDILRVEAKVDALLSP